MDVLKPDIRWTFYLKTLPLKQAVIGNQDVGVFAKVITCLLK